MANRGRTEKSGGVPAEVSQGSGEMLAFELAAAAERGEIVAYYQPQIDLATGAIVGAEALSRWRHPRLGVVAPDDFIPIAEHSGAIHRIGEFMLDTGCDYARDLRARGLPVEVAVNVSAEQLTTPDFFNRVVENSRIYDLQPGDLTLEITESQVITDPVTVGARLNLLRRLGFGVSIDDFGTGSSSFGQLDQLPVTELKLDRSLLRNESASGAALMQAIVALGLERSLRVVVEGVETEADLARARSLGAHRVQGFLLGHPVPREDLDRMLAEQPAG